MSLSSITITARHSNGSVETVYSGDPSGAGDFQGPYDGPSAIEGVTGGFDWDIRRSGGWIGSSVELTIDALDSDGNHTIETIVWHLPISGLLASVVLAGIVQGSLASDPAVSGVAAPVGTVLPRSGFNELWQKFGLLDTDWRILGQRGAYATGSVTIAAGRYLLLCGHLVLSSVQRVRLLGTGRLAIRS